MNIPSSLDLSSVPPVFAQYIASHNEPITASEHDRTFAIIKPYINPGVVLDWGCYAGLDAWRVRETFGASIAMHGCDVHPPLFAKFWDTFGMKYETLSHPYKLPYSDNMFDTVIGAGTLEHVPDESASLRELWRIIKPNGRLLLSHLPQRYSFIEAVLRMRNDPHHKRRYTRTGIYRKLIDHGFIPLMLRCHHSTPMRGPKPLRQLWRALAPAIERSPVAFMTQNLLVAAEKQHGIGGEFFKKEKLTVYEQSW